MKRYFALLTLILCIPTIAFSAKDKSLRQLPYPVYGKTYDVLSQQLNQSSSKYRPSTKWQVGWKYNFTNQGSGCQLADIQTERQVTMRLPKWENYKTSSSDLQNAWDVYIKALEAQQMQHVKLSIDAQNAVKNALGKLPSYASCTKLKEAVTATASKVISQYKQKDAKLAAKINEESLRIILAKPQ